MGTPSQAADIGQAFRYTHPEGKGFGEHHIDGEITAEMRELDLKDGTVVKLEAWDEATGWPVVSWVDAVGIDRMTTIDVSFFDDHFVAEGQ